MSLGFEVNLCRRASEVAREIYEYGKFGLPYPDLPDEKKHLVLRPLTGRYKVINVESFGAKVVASSLSTWIVDVELHLEWNDGEEELLAVHRFACGFDNDRMIFVSLHRVPHVGWDTEEQFGTEN